MSTVIDMEWSKRDFAKRLKVARNGQGLTQQQASDEVGVVYRTFQAWEAAEVLPDGENALRIAVRFGVRPRAFPGDSAKARERTYASLGMLLPSVDLARSVASG